MHVTVVGAGVAGLSCALELARRGVAVNVLERSEQRGPSGCSWFAGAMLAPWCELETAEPLVAHLGEQGLRWWREHFSGTVQTGSLVLAHARDDVELDRFARRTSHWLRIGRDRVNELEPDLAPRFERALYFENEAHLDPRTAAAALERYLRELDVPIRYGVDAASVSHASDCIVDCRGLDARDVLHDLRGVKGEMLLLRTRELHLSRAVRVLHPRHSIYVVPRGPGLFMIGATQIESDDRNVGVRSILESLNAVYALHPAFADAHVIEIGAGVRPAFPNNLPRLRWHGRTLFVNGLYRHGFLLAPPLSRMAADAVLHDRWFPEVMDEDHRQRRCS